MAIRPRVPMTAESAALGLLPGIAAMADPGWLLAAGVLTLAGYSARAARRALLPPVYTGDAAEFYRLARSYGIYQTTGPWARLKPGRPFPRTKIARRPDGQQTLGVWEAYDATARTAEPMGDFWARFRNDLERATGRDWAIQDDPGDRWVWFHPAQPLPEADELQRPADTLRGGNPLLVPHGVYRNDAGELAELLVDLTDSHEAIAGAPGTGKTSLGRHIGAHLLATAAGPVELLDPKKATWPRAIATYPGVAALATDPDQIYQRLLANQAIMRRRYAEAERLDWDPKQIAARDGHRFLLLEELAELLAIFRARRKPRSKQAAATFVGADQVVEVVGSLARAGREAGIHLICIAQEWNAAQFGEAGGSVRRLFVARTSGWQDRGGGKMLDLPDAENLPVRDGRALLLRFVLNVEGRLPVRYQAYGLTRTQVLVAASRAGSGRLAPPHQPMPSASLASRGRPRPSSFVGRGGGAAPARPDRSASGQGRTALAAPNLRETTPGDQSDHAT